MDELSSYYHLTNMLTLGVLTGSRAFNCSHEDSDWDIVITMDKLLNYNQVPTVVHLIDFNKPWNEPQYDADGLECIQELYDGSIWGDQSLLLISTQTSTAIQLIYLSMSINMKQFYLCSLN